MNDLTVRPDSWIEDAPARCSASLEIAASPADICADPEDHESWPPWFDGVKEVTVTGAASGVGATRHVRLSGIEFDEEFIAWDVNERFAFAVVAASRGIFTSISERVTIEDLGEGRSLVTYSQAFTPAGWFTLPLELVLGRFRRSLNKALAALSARLES